MKSKYTGTLLLQAVFVAVSLSAEVSAQGTTFFLSIVGSIEQDVCTPLLSGTGVSGNTLTLPTVPIAMLDTAGKTAGESTISFSIVNCSVAASIDNMWVYFNGANVAGGRIVSSDSNVHFEICDDAACTTQVHAGGTASNQPDASQGTAAPFTGSYPSRNASKNYVIRYYANQPVTQAGTVSANASYEVRYY